MRLSARSTWPTPSPFMPTPPRPRALRPFRVRGGDHLQVDLHLNPVPALRLLFQVPRDLRRGFSVPQLQRNTFDGISYVQTGAVRQVSPGLMEIAGVPAGRYDIQLNQTAGSPAMRMSDVEVTRDGQELEPSSAEFESSVKVSVRIPGESTVPAGLLVGMRSGGRIVNWQSADAKGKYSV